MTLETASGTEVPAAKNVIPITESGMFNVLPEKLRNDNNKKKELESKQLNISSIYVVVDNQF